MKKSEYTVHEMKDFITMMSGMYDVARVVDPVECRVLDLNDDGTVSMCASCYEVWHSDQRCINCSSFAACRTGVHTEKSEHFKNDLYRIHSNPVKLKLPDGGVHDAVVELISITRNTENKNGQANDRESENVDYKAIHYQASHDMLTKVLNAEAFYELSRKRILEERDVPWVMITGNIQEFRLVNNLFGVLKGNEVLVHVADLLHTIAKERGGLCCRQRADQFAMLIPGNCYQEEILADAASEISGLIKSGTFTVRMHFGVYEIKESSLPISVMCDRANIALLTIKNDARRVVAYFDGSLMKKRLFEQEVISIFEQVLEEGQFKIFLQPITGEDGTPVGAEALVRWIRPDGTVVYPGEFIGILEDAGLIPDLDMHVWELAVKQLRLWKGTEKEKLTISVNMSARDFYYIDIYETLSSLLKKYDVESSKLRLEITETTLIEDAEQTKETLQKLRDAGFYLEIDDFGKGYSSLSMLKDIHADMLKIDMAFTHVTTNVERNRIIVGSIISMARALGMEVVTEGVETEEQLKRLSSMGCHRFQGYYFSKPIPVEEFESKYYS